MRLEDLLGFLLFQIFLSSCFPLDHYKTLVNHLLRQLVDTGYQEFLQELLQEEV